MFFNIFTIFYYPASTIYMHVFAILIYLYIIFLYSFFIHFFSNQKKTPIQISTEIPDPAVEASPMGNSVSTKYLEAI